jgi:SAM-dependent methyltransferase
MDNLVFVDSNCDVCGSWNSNELLKAEGSAYHECTSCGLIFSRPMPVNLEEIYELQYSRRLDLYANKIDEKRKKNRKKLKKFDQFRKSGNFLEIGCNAGAVLCAARDAGWKVKGVDVSPAPAAFAREKMDLDVFTGTVEEAGYPDNYFDVIFTNATLEHLRHPLATLKECRRILRPGGVFYADTVNWASYTRRLLGANWKLINPSDHVHLYTPSNILSLCHQAGFDHLKTWTTGVRVKANAPESTFKTPWHWSLLKGPLSFLIRLNKMGDSIEFIAQKPLG